MSIRERSKCLVTHLRMVCRETEVRSFSMSETMGAISRWARCAVLPLRCSAACVLGSRSLLRLRMLSGCCSSISALLLLERASLRGALSAVPLCARPSRWTLF